MTTCQPFHLSRSNSRRTRDVVLSEKEEEEKRQQEQLEAEKKKALIAKEVPVTTYTRKFNVYKSTQSLTEFEEFSLSHRSRDSMTPNTQRGLRLKKKGESEYSQMKIKER